MLLLLVIIFLVTTNILIKTRYLIHPFKIHVTLYTGDLKVEAAGNIDVMCC